jgi:PAS domain S-box-containing protein
MTTDEKDLKKRLHRAENIIEALQGDEIDAVVTKNNVVLLRLRQTEEKLRRSEERLRLALEVGKIGTRFLEIPSGKFDMSDRGRQIYGLPPEGEVTIRDLLDRVHPEDRPGVENTLGKALDDPVEFENEYRVIHPDGSEHWVSTRGKTFLDAQGKTGCNISMAVDITEKKTYEQQLISFNKMLESRVNERTSQVESQAKHLRALANRLTRVEHEERKRLARILHDEVQQLLVGARMSLGAVKRCTRMEQVQAFAGNVDNTLAQALEISRSLALDLCPPAIEENGLCGGLKWFAARMLKNNNFTVHLDMDPSAEPDTHNNRILLFESARELVLNAVKHAGVQDVHIILEKNRDDCVFLTVADEGNGFDPDCFKNRPSEEVTFGLFHIRERLAHIGGEVNISSAPDAGTRITLTCPLQHS